VLRAAGQHLKRGLLLHGAPGTGKTHTVRYLIGRLPVSTVIVLTGEGLHFAEQAAALARRLQPSIVVLEDAGLVARDMMGIPAQPRRGGVHKPGHLRHHPRPEPAHGIRRPGPRTIVWAPTSRGGR
jgi:MoxR-like ATPase